MIEELVQVLREGVTTQVAPVTVTVLRVETVQT